MAAIKDYVEKKCIHFYEDEDGKEMVEMHADDLYTYDDNQNSLPILNSLGGNVSVRKPEATKPVIIFGQDEAIYRSSQQNES